MKILSNLIALIIGAFAFWNWGKERQENKQLKAKANEYQEWSKAWANANDMSGSERLRKLVKDKPRNS